ncbi:GNAT family N-acetyltransferase [Fredinandcohnia sp. 179-A 10B2 NHS]|uniref:GNAT family N-acetyltransferase n=1 Tax=Fredinandcohnia sp. 179-A 10B2 NHS TaxID=3235176 RepID=UPI0039A3E6B0
MLITERLCLVPCTLASFTDSNYPLLDHIQYALNQTESDQSTIGWYVWLAKRKEDGKTVGDIGFKGKPVNGTVEIGYGIDPDEHNKGYATEAAIALVEWAFLHEAVRKVQAECDIDNVASIRVLEKLGMKRIEEMKGMIYWGLERSSV